MRLVAIGAGGHDTAPGVLAGLRRHVQLVEVVGKQLCAGGQLSNGRSARQRLGDQVW